MKGGEELRACELILDLGVSVPYRPLRFLSKKGRHGIVMRTPCMGGMIRVVRRYLKLGVSYEEIKEYTFDERMAFIAQHGAEVSRIVAGAIVSGRISGWLLNGIVAWWLRWRVHPAYLDEAMRQVLEHLRIQDFSTIIRSADAMNVMTRRLSHGNSGS